MIRIIDKSNRALHAEILNQVFRLRHDVFVKELGWHQFDVDGIYERDQYDDEHAIYLVSIDGWNRIVGCCRLYPSSRPHMLSEFFSHFVEGTVPQRADVFEITRAAVSRDSRGGTVHAELLTGAHEYCEMQGASAITSFIRVLRVPYFLAEGIRLTPLGMPGECEGEMLVAVSMEVSEDVISEMWKRAGFVGSVLEREVAHRKIA